jgi:hypothetical protein
MVTHAFYPHFMARSPGFSRHVGCGSHFDCIQFRERLPAALHFMK